MQHVMLLNDWPLIGLLFRYSNICQCNGRKLDDLSLTDDIGEKEAWRPTHFS
jgi:hypothetical protein